MNELQIIDCAQGSEAWFQARLGIPTSSEFDSVLAKGKSGAPSKTRATYMRKLAGEVITKLPMYAFTNDHLERGKEQEEEALALYTFQTDAELKKIGFLRRGQAGASPDALIGEEGCLECKTKLAHLQIELLESGEVPSEHIAQIQGQLWISGRRWVEFISYSPGLPLFIKRVMRDENYIARIKVEVDVFNKELAALVERINRYNGARA